jgi:putative flippase GtrA
MLNRLNPMSIQQRASVWAPRGRQAALAFKAVSFAVVGLVNTLIDACIFFSAYALIGASPAAQSVFSQAAAACGCSSGATLRLIACNALSWSVAVSCSYVMNSFITFAAESGGKLRWRNYATFAASGVVGAVANTTVLVLAAQVLPVWLAKGLAILTSFVVNFSLSLFFVFPSKPTTESSASLQTSEHRPPP